MQDPELFLNDLSLGVNCAVERDKAAVISAAYRVSVGYETYFVCDSAALEKFRGNIPEYCGTLTDPVTKARFRPSDNSPRTAYLERLYFFASDSSKQAFDMMPDNYAWPQHHMIPVDSAKTEMKPM